MEIIDRKTWGAVYADGAGPAPLPAREVWLHHTVTAAPDLVPPYDDEDRAVRLVEQIGQQKFNQGISYTFVVMPSGRIYKGHSVDRLGAHTAKRNSIARAIVLVGNYEHAPPTAQQCESTAQLLAHGWREGWWTAPRLNGGHRQAPGAKTACPGQQALNAIPGINARAATLAANPEEDDPLAALSDAEARELLTRVRSIDAREDWFLVPDDDPRTPYDERQPSSKGEMGKRIRSIDSAVGQLVKREPLTAAAIADAIPAGLARGVVDELLSRIRVAPE